MRVKCKLVSAFAANLLLMAGHVVGVTKESCAVNALGSSWTYPFPLVFDAKEGLWKSPKYDYMARPTTFKCHSGDDDFGVSLGLIAGRGKEPELAGANNARNSYRVVVQADNVPNKVFYFWLDHLDVCSYCFNIGKNTKIVEIAFSIND